MSRIDRVARDELEEWRAHPVTRALLKDLDDEHAGRRDALVIQAATASIDQQRVTAGFIQGVAFALGLCRTKGSQQREDHHERSEEDDD